MEKNCVILFIEEEYLNDIVYLKNLNKHTFKYLIRTFKHLDIEEKKRYYAYLRQILNAEIYYSDHILLKKTDDAFDKFKDMCEFFLHSECCDMKFDTFNKIIKCEYISIIKIELE